MLMWPNLTRPELCPSMPNTSSRTRATSSSQSRSAHPSSSLLPPFLPPSPPSPLFPISSLCPCPGLSPPIKFLQTLAIQTSMCVCFSRYSLSPHPPPTPPLLHLPPPLQPPPPHTLQANCIDSTAEPTKVFAGEIKKLQADKLKPQEQLTLEPYERDHAVVVGVYRYIEAVFVGVCG